MIKEGTKTLYRTLLGKARKARRNRRGAIGKDENNTQLKYEINDRKATEDYN